MITAETYRERIARSLPHDLEAQIVLMQDVVEDNVPDNELVAFYRDVAIPIAQARLGQLPATTDPKIEDTVKVYDSLGRARQQGGQGGANLISDKQLNFLRKLIAEKDTTGIEIPENIDRIGKVRCSALIDRLIDRPRKGVPAGEPTVRLATEKQVAFLVKLANERVLTNLANGEPLTDPAHVAKLPSKDVSQLIDFLMGQPRRPVAQAAPLTAGAYRLADGRIVRVYLGQQSGKMLAAELVDITAEDRDDAWKYLGRADRFVKETDHRLTIEEAEALAASGADHSWCCVCGRALNDPNSVARGIGPVCRARQGG